MLYQQALVDKTRRRDLLVNLLDLTCSESPRYTYLRIKRNFLPMIRKKYDFILPFDTVEMWYDMFYEYAQSGEEPVMTEDTYWKCMKLLHNRFAYMNTPLRTILFQRMCTIYYNRMTLMEFLLSLLMFNDTNTYCTSIFSEFIEDTLDYINKHPLEEWTHEIHSPLVLRGIRITYEFLESVYQHRECDTKMYRDVYTLLIRMNTIQ